MPSFRAHPAVGVKPESWSPPAWLGITQPSFAWMRLDFDEQQRRYAAFNEVLFRYFADYPDLTMRIRPKRGGATPVPPEAELAWVGGALEGAIDGADLRRWPASGWRDLQLMSAGKVVFSDCEGEFGVTLLIDADEAVRLHRVLESIASSSEEAKEARTLRAAVLVALYWTTFLVVVVALVAVWNGLSGVVGTWIGFAGTLVLLIVLVKFVPVDAIGGVVRRLIYGPTT